MIIVYDAANSVEAYMVKNMLEQHEIPAYIQGEHLQSAAGELPMSGLVKVSVDNENLRKAKEVIKSWEAQETADKVDNLISEKVVKTDSKLTNFMLLIASFALGAVLMNLYLQTPVRHDGIDLNGDKINDISWTYKNNLIVKTESDFNFDGKVDEITLFKSNGLMDTTKQDADFDGVFETEYQYENERVTTQRTDTNGDGEFDYLSEFEDKNNSLDSKVTLFDLKTNLIKKVQHYKMSKLVSAELDTNNDGKLDVLISYDFAEEEASRKPIANK